MERALFGAAASALVIAITFSFGCSAPSTEELASQSLAAGVNGSTITGTVMGYGLRVRPTPSKTQPEIAVLQDGQVVTISCQTTGDTEQGNSVWNFLPDYDGYVSDAYVYTGVDGFHSGAPRCGVPGNSGNAPTPKPDTGSTSSIVAEARKHLGKVEGANNCNEFSTALGRPCEEWCSDFVNYVWMKAGYRTDGITGYSGTIADYGRKYGTYKAGKYATAKVGDAVLWGYGSAQTADVPSKHVGMVTEVYADNSIKVIHGNFGPAPDGVKESVITRESDVGTGHGIYAFVSPVR